MTDRPHRPVLIDPAAEAEIAHAAASYDALRPGLADAMFDELERTRRDIEDFPEGCQEVEPGIRRALFHRFPYSIIYCLSADAIRLVALFPTRADSVTAAARIAERIPS